MSLNYCPSMHSLYIRLLLSCSLMASSASIFHLAASCGWSGTFLKISRSYEAGRGNFSYESFAQTKTTGAQGWSRAFRNWTKPLQLPKGSNVVPFWVCYGFLVWDQNILPKKELHRRVWVCMVCGNLKTLTLKCLFTPCFMPYPQPKL